MSEEIILKLVALCGSAIFLIVGLIQLRWPPKKINHVYGYRTPRSMKNMDTWVEANRFSSLMMVRLGMYMLFGGIVIAFLPQMHPTVYVGYILLVLPVAITMLVATEKHLKNVFDDHGQRR